MGFYGYKVTDYSLNRQIFADLFDEYFPSVDDVESLGQLTVGGFDMSDAASLQVVDGRG